MAKILIVDDTAFMRMMLREILTKGGHEVIGEAGNGEEAIAKYREAKPDLVTMDITMPDMDGLTAVQKIRQIDSAARIIMCSAMGQQNMVLDAMKAGARDFIVKPFQPDRVLDSIQKALS